MKELLRKHIRKEISALFEGLLKTHPPQTSKRIIEKKFGSDLNVVWDTGTDRLILDVTNFTEFEKLFPLVNNLGYFISAIDLYEKNGKDSYEKFFKGTLERVLKNKEKYQKIELILEAKFDKEQVKIPSTLFHVTNAEKIKKILNQGLVQKTNSKKTYHPERIYVTSSTNFAEDFVNRLKSENKENKYGLIAIKTEFLPSIKLYSDPNYEQRGYYVLENIPPIAISVIKII